MKSVKPPDLIKKGKTGPLTGPGKINSAFQGLPKISPQTQKKQSIWASPKPGIWNKPEYVAKLQETQGVLTKNQTQLVKNFTNAGLIKPQSGEAGESTKTPLEISANARPAAPGAPIKTTTSSNALPRTPLQPGKTLDLGTNLKSGSSTDSPKKPRTAKQQQEIKEKRAARKQAKTRKAEAKQKKQAAEAEAAQNLTESTPSPKQAILTVPVTIQGAIIKQQTASNFAQQAAEGLPRIPDQYQRLLNKYEAKQNKYTLKYEINKYNVVNKHYINSQKLAMTQQSLATQVAEYDKKHPPGSKPHITVNPFKILSRALSKNKYKRNLRAIGDYNTKQRQINSERNSKLSRIESKEDRKKKMINAKKSLVTKRIQKGEDTKNFQVYIKKKIQNYETQKTDAEANIERINADITIMVRNPEKNKETIKELEKQKAFYDDSIKHYEEKILTQTKKQKEIANAQEQLILGDINKEDFENVVSKMAADSRGYSKGSHGNEKKKQKQRDKIQEAEVKSKQTSENYKLFVDSKLVTADKEIKAIDVKLGNLLTKTNPDPNDIAKIEELKKLKAQHETDISKYFPIKKQIDSLQSFPPTVAISEIGKLASKSKTFKYDERQRYVSQYLAGTSFGIENTQVKADPTGDSNA